eukprot:GHVU01063398.1.p1 GENE.GHVU01063398.1~~GHVU01063398.1.p1  ORF type:complete len:193 (-),score=5.14 GHVU01063398.1:61-639(-)
MFFGQIRCGEVLTDFTNISQFDPLDKPSVYSLGRYNEQCGRCLPLPSTKMQHVRGEDVVLTSQDSIADPNDAINRHIRINKLRPDDPLFAYQNSTGNLTLLARNKCLEVCNALWSKNNVPRITGHCFRIGGTTHYLLAGIPCDVVKVLGRWKSDAFTKYWRNLDSLASIHIHRLHTQNNYSHRLNHALRSKL